MVASLIKDEVKEVHTISFRGHSYNQDDNQALTGKFFKAYAKALLKAFPEEYKEQSVEQIERHLCEQVKIGMIGSCGGTHEINDLLKKFPNMHPIGTTETGVMAVNDPLVKHIGKSAMNCNETFEWNSV